MKLTEIADQILVYLKKFEADPIINSVTPGLQMKTHPYYSVNAWAGKKYVYVRYVSYHSDCALTKDEAMIYLEWLIDGNVGTHYKALAEAEKGR